MAVTQEVETEGGKTGSIGGERHRRRRAHAPACFRGTGFSGGAEPRQDHGDAGLLCRQHQAARGIEVERLRRAPDLADDGGDGRASRRLDGGAQGRSRIPGTNEQQRRRIEADGVEAVGRELADFAQRLFLRGPDDRAAACTIAAGPQGQCRSEAPGRDSIRRPLRHDLVQGAALEPATHRAIDRAVIEHEAPVLVFAAYRLRPGRFDFGQASPQRRELFSLRGHGFMLQVHCLF